MSHLILFSDPHLGLSRAAHTTIDSSRNWRDSLFHAAKAAPQVAISEAGAGTTFTACLGDLFDRYTADAQSILQGCSVLEEVDLLLVGNHDLSNRTDTVSSLQLMDRMLHMELFGDSKFSVHYPDQAASLYSINHQLTQQAFDQCLDEAQEDATRIFLPEHKILLLHCNYESPFATGDASLNLSRERAEQLLDVFSMVIIGHEHQSRQDFDGRLLLVGNTHPTSFSDIGDKFSWSIDLRKDKLVAVPHLVWSVDKSYLSVDWSELDTVSDIGEQIQFIDVIGEADAKHMATIQQQVTRLFSMRKGLLAVRNGVHVNHSHDQANVGDTVRLASVPDRVTAALEGNKLQALWSSYLGKVQ